MVSGGSLRDQYVPPPSAWSFQPAPGANSSGPSASGPSPTYQYNTRPAHNSVLDMSPSLAFTEPSAANASVFLKAFVATAVMQYSTHAIAMPWDVGRTLLQVQWVPRDAGEVDFPVEEEEVQDEESEASSNEEDTYFTDPSRARITRRPKPRPADERGYVLRPSVLDEGTRPEYIIPVGSADGVWGMIKRVGRFRGEGWFSLWKGLLTSCVYDALSASLQPLIHHSIHALIAPPSLMHHNSLLVPLASHVVTGVLLSPLDLIRTRLIVQSAMPRHRTYTGPLDALDQIIRFEGGLRGLYLHPHLLIPTLLDTLATSFSALVLPGLLARSLGAARLSPETNPIAWSLAEFAGSAAGLLLTLPCETVRRRLQVQTRGSARPLRTAVETRPAPYNGVVDTLWHVLTEERSDLPLRPRIKRRRPSNAREGEEQKKEEEEEHESWLKNTGIGQLYRGLGMRLSASAIVFLLAMVGGGDSELGWTEL